MQRYTVSELMRVYWERGVRAPVPPLGSYIFFCVHEQDGKLYIHRGNHRFIEGCPVDVVDLTEKGGEPRWP